MKQSDHVTSRNRLKGFDYRSPGYYFLTFCTNNRRSIFGQVKNGEMSLTPAGEMIGEIIENLGISNQHVTVDAFVIMPNHVHLLIYLGIENESVSISALIRQIKGVSAARYRQGVSNLGWQNLNGDLWQKKFYDHVVRNERELFTIRKYIVENPLRWEIDELNPDG